MEPENAPIWEEYFGGHEGAYSRFGKEGDQGNADRTAEGGIALVRAQLRLLRSALADAGNGWFVLLPGTSLPVRPLGDLRRSLRWDGRSRFAWAAPPDLDAAQEEEA
ncbi:MAG: beta-1,6-N-acetylglucosaminyltransferase [Verrucomicrobiales bacterium]